jgi:glyoxylase-like metal-dependent hydrolase (beta-lactamase superfamily II)
MTGPPPSSWAVDPAAASAREVVPGVWRLRLPMSWEGIDHVNAYVVAREDGIMLVDCGAGGDPSCLEALTRAIAQTGHRLSDVRALVLTHAHTDHLGVAGAVLDASGATLYGHADSAHFHDVWREPELIAAKRRRRARLERVPERRLDAYADLREELAGTDGVRLPDRAIADGDRLPSALGSWEVVQTPGHAPSHVALLQRERGLLIAGDLVCIAFVPWMDYGYSADPVAETLASLDRIGGLGTLTLTLPGHGRPLFDLAATIAGHRAGFEARLDTLRGVLWDSPGSGYALTERIWGVENDIDAVGHLTEVVCLLRHLRLAGEVARVTDPGGGFRYDLRIRERAA